MNEIYEKPVLKLTEFDSEDVITTSGEITTDKNNAYSTLNLLDGSGDRKAPTDWY
ncbi:MAG: hypothetical protein IJI50_01670 [Ruminococcus sp.]|nr:hypothetical protein [Ruminococcus sp.]